MGNTPKLHKILAPTVPCVLAVTEALKVELKLAWTMKSVILIETKLRRDFGIQVNVLQNPGQFWTDMDATMLAVGIWACAQQEHADQFAGDAGFDLLTSYIVNETYGAAATGLHDAFFESLSDERKAAVKKAEEEAAAKQAAGEASPTVDPTKAPVESV